MSYNKVFFVQIRRKTAQGWKFLFPTECFNDYSEALKKLKSEVAYYGTLGYTMERDEQIKDLYSVYKDGVQMYELTIGRLIIR